MRKNRLMVQILVTVFIMSCLGTAGAAESVMTVFPKGVVKVTETNGQVVRLTTNFPLKDGSIMEPSGGQCTVQGSNCSFIAQDKARFSLNNVGGKQVCTLYSGKVNYVLHSDSMVKFVHADAVYDCQKITPATAGGSVEGSAAVVDDKLVFTNTAGELVFVPVLAGAAGAPLVVGPAAAGGISTTGLAVAGAGVGAAAGGAALGLSSGKGAASGQ
jgi:hypothetical protein